MAEEKKEKETQEDAQAEARAETRGEAQTEPRDESQPDIVSWLKELKTPSGRPLGLLEPIPEASPCPGCMLYSAVDLWFLDRIARGVGRAVSVPNVTIYVEQNLVDQYNLVLPPTRRYVGTAEAVQEGEEYQGDEVLDAALIEGLREISLEHPVRRYFFVVNERVTRMESDARISDHAVGVVVKAELVQSTVPQGDVTGDGTCYLHVMMFDPDKQTVAEEEVLRKVDTLFRQTVERVNAARDAPMKELQSASAPSPPLSAAYRNTIWPSLVMGRVELPTDRMFCIQRVQQLRMVYGEPRSEKPGHVLAYCEAWMLLIAMVYLCFPMEDVVQIEKRILDDVAKSHGGLTDLTDLIARFSFNIVRLYHGAHPHEKIMCCYDKQGGEIYFKSDKKQTVQKVKQ